MNILAIVDYFGARPTWLIGGYNKSYSRAGIVLTVVIIAYVIWALVYLSSDLVHRQNPKVTQSNFKGSAV